MREISAPEGEETTPPEETGVVHLCQTGVPSCLPGEVFNPVIGSCETPPATD